MEKNERKKTTIRKIDMATWLSHTLIALQTMAKRNRTAKQWRPCYVFYAAERYTKSICKWAWQYVPTTIAFNYLQFALEVVFFRSFVFSSSCSFSVLSHIFDFRQLVRGRKKSVQPVVFQLFPLRLIYFWKSLSRFVASVRRVCKCVLLCVVLSSFLAHHTTPHRIWLVGWLSRHVK